MYMIKYSKIVPVIVLLVLASCKSKKVITTKSTNKKYVHKTTVPRIGKPSVKNKHERLESNKTSISEANKIIRKALSYKGTRYKLGGTSKSGMDCSGLMYSSFKVVDMVLPRTSIEQSKKGVRVSKSKADKGDLVFFKTNGKRKINHVGLVVSVDDRDVKFVHSSSSRGVMISSLKEGYWSNSFSEIRRLNLGQLNDDEVTEYKQPVHKKSYTVKNGDTLYAIARKFEGVSVDDIIVLNNLKSTTLKLGMQLLIP